MKMQKMLALVMALTVLVTLAACGGGDFQTTTAATTTTPAATTAAATKATAAATKATTAAPALTEVTLYADFSCGSQTAHEDGLIRTETVELEEVTPMNLADALSEWTGLDFELDRAAVEGSVLTVDWSADSTLVGGLDDREQKEEFFFFDNVTLSWFMLDSLYQTMLANLDVEEVYYTMDGGGELVVYELYPVGTFPADIPYMRSPFYYAHSDLKGEDARVPALRFPGGFTGLMPLEAENDFDGVYFYQDMTEDGLTIISNCCFASLLEDNETPYDYIDWAIWDLFGYDAEELAVQESVEHAERLTYPVYILNWQYGSNEDTRICDGFFFMTDTHTYLYAFDTAGDHHEAMYDTWMEVFGQLVLEDVQ